MNKKFIIFILLSLFFAQSIIAKENNTTQEIDYKFYVNGASIYYYLATYDDRKGDIFIDWGDNLYVVNNEGTSVYDSRGTMVSHVNEKLQIPVKSDKTGNIFVINQDKLIKLSPNKDVISVFKMDKDFRLIHIDDKSNYYFIVLRKDYKTKEYQDEIRKIEEKQRELENLNKYQKLGESGAIEAIDKKLLDYRDEKRELEWDLKELETDYNDYWKKYEFETAAAEKSKLKTNLDDNLNRTRKIQDRLRFIAKDTDDLDDRKRMINEQLEKERENKKKDNQDEINRLNEELSRINKLMADDLKMNHEIRVFTEDKFLVKDYPLPVPQEGIPLFSCNITVSDKDGNFYGSDGKRIYLYDWDGNLTASFEGSNENRAISQLAVDSKKNIYAMDQINNRIIKFGTAKPSLNSLK